MRKLYLSSLLAMACLAFQTTVQAGFYTVTYAVTGSSSTGATPSPTNPNFSVSVTGQPSGNLNATMTAQATLTWNPSFPGEQPPQQITIQEWVSESATDSGQANSLMILFSNPLLDPVVTQTSTPTFLQKSCSTPSGSPHTFLLNQPGTSRLMSGRVMSCHAYGVNFTANMTLGYTLSVK